MDQYGKTLVGASGINGDDFYISQDGRVYAISDGASGAFDKVAVSNICMTSIQQMDNGLFNIRPQDYIKYCFNVANKRLIEKSQQDGKLSFGTLTMAVVDEGVLTVGVVGDTPAFLIQSGKIKKIVEPRKRYNLLIEYEILSKEEIDKAISSIPNEMISLFDVYLPMIVPEVTIEEYEVNKGDILFICSDGISDWVRLEEFILILDSNISLNECFKIILDLVEKRCDTNRLDDRTMVVARL